MGGIRTHEWVSPLPVFKTGAFNRSATSPFCSKHSTIPSGRRYRWIVPGSLNAMILAESLFFDTAAFWWIDEATGEPSWAVTRSCMACRGRSRPPRHEGRAEEAAVDGLRCECYKSCFAESRKLLRGPSGVLGDESTRCALD
ncbi:MAG: hypothetical protein RIS70_2196 [Planctomycetota bacterium]